MRVIPSSFKIGSLSLSSNLTLSPLAGYTNLPFRLVIRSLGGVGLCTTDLVNARSLIEKNPKAYQLIASNAKDTPIAVQIFGSVPEEMAEAAMLLESLGVQSVDVNMGCPVPKVCKIGGGAAMMNEPEKAAALLKKIVTSVKIPITCKMRLGWDEENITAPELSKALEDVGVAAITVHGRTRGQGFKGGVHLEGIRAVAKALKRIPLIGNGDITTPQLARQMIESTGCHGIGIGRGAFYNPWIFRDTEYYLRTGKLKEEPPFEERINVVRMHLELMTEVFGEKDGCLMFRKVGPWYAKRFGPSSFFNRRIVRLENRENFEEIIEQYIEWRSQFLDNEGKLLTRYEPMQHENTLIDSDEELPASVRRVKIPVPSGPQDLW